MWRNIASNALNLIAVAVFLAAGALIWAQDTYRGPGPLAEAICLEVPRGSTMRRVSEDLAGQGAISSAFLFRVGADYTGKTAELKAGSYLIQPETGMAQIVDIITRGGASTCGTEVVYRIGIARVLVEIREVDPATGRFEEQVQFNPGEGAVPSLYAEVKGEADTRYRVALAEGVTSWQVVEELNRIDVLEGEVAVPPEGSLAPNSYDIRPGDTRADLIARMRAAQDRILAIAWEARAEGLPLETPQEALILASIIEKETSVPEERPQIASVFVNRLEQGMRLQTDPTVIYGVTEGRGVLGRGLRRSELDRPTPWNTYQIAGLPPTPIANPGRASIEAALNPADTDLLFFVARTLDPDDGHAFAETLAEHNRNVAAYRAAERAAE
jgi:UPF0755 protein